MLTAARLRELVDYDPATGIFRWRLKRRGCKPGKPLSAAKNSEGYVTAQIDQITHGQHRLAWLYMTGEWPDGLVDHRNRDRSDNRFDNLRCVSGTGNNLNAADRPAQKALPGVVRYSDGFVARLMIRGKREVVGPFPTQEAAHAAYRLAREAALSGHTR